MFVNAAMVCLVCGAGTGCAGRGASGDVSVEASADSVPAAIRELTDALAAGDAHRFAELVSYPLSRPYPLHDILDEAAMVDYYPELVDDSLKRVVVSATLDDWNGNGWRGWTLGDGSYLWVDEAIYEVPYVSVREHHRRSELAQREMGSLPLKFRSGWVPMACMRSVSSAAVYRLDHNPRAHAGSDYRMMMWDDVALIPDNPKAVFIGRCHIEGSAGTHSYFLASSSGAKAVYLADITSAEERPRILFTDRNGINHTDTVAAAYWLDLLGQ